MLRWRLSVLSLNILVGAVLAISCGGGGGSSSPTAPTATATTTTTTTTTSSLGVCGITTAQASVTPTFDIITIPAGDLFYGAATKCIRVFGVMVMAVDSGPEITDAKLKHAATIAAEWLDNDEDGIVDSSAVNNAIREKKATVAVINGDGDLGVFLNQVAGEIDGNAQEVGVGEMWPDNCKGCGQSEYDAAMEEILHLIQNNGWSQAYPDINDRGTATNKLTAAMDVARGGNFLSIPASYPASAWYTYNDATCDYTCQLTEYLFWLVTSAADGNSHRCSKIEQEWDLCTRALVESTDALGWAILTDVSYNLPSVHPNGVYR